MEEKLTAEELNRLRPAQSFLRVPSRKRGSEMHAVVPSPTEKIKSYPDWTSLLKGQSDNAWDTPAFWVAFLNI